MPSRLFIIATPIGNLGDISIRAKTVLQDVHLILAEDTRTTLKLLNHLGLKKRLVSCHDFNERKRLVLLKELSSQNVSVALVSDAGSPLISDPGYLIVQEAIKLSMDITVIPGPSAFLVALMGSGLPCKRFAFEGFLPDRKGLREKRLQQMKDDERTLAFYIAPNNLLTVLDELITVLGDRSACLARELTKKHEEYLHCTLAEIRKKLSNRLIKGEYVLVVAGSSASSRLNQDKVVLRVEQLLGSGGRLKEVAVTLGKETGWSASEIYKLGLKYLEKKNLKWDNCHRRTRD